MRLILVLWVAFNGIYANPFPSDSNDLSENLASSADPFGFESDSKSKDDPGSLPLPYSIVDTNSKIECSSDASEDGYSVLKGQGSCSTNIVIPEIGDLEWKKFISRLQISRPARRLRRPTKSLDERCRGYPGRPNAVTCGGPEVSARFNSIALVMNCVPGFTTTKIETRGTIKVFEETSLVAQYCCVDYAPDDWVFFGAGLCTKLTLVEMPQMSGYEYLAELQRIKEQLGLP